MRRRSPDFLIPPADHEKLRARAAPFQHTHSSRCSVLNPATFTSEIRALSEELATVPETNLNQAAARLDQLGRRLHGLEWRRGDEIGRCLSAAVRELTLARDQTGDDRAAAIRNAIRELNGALRHADEGVLPWEEHAGS